MNDQASIHPKSHPLAAHSVHGPRGGANAH
jgi:hypothetical protein